MTTRKKRITHAARRSMLFDPALLGAPQRATRRGTMEWDELLSEQLLERGLPSPEHEYMFAVPLGRKWRFDAAWPGYRIAFEQEGAAFGRVIVGADGNKYRLGGRHNTGAGMQADCEKYSWASILGWCVIRATTTMIRDEKAISLIVAAFKARGWKEAGDVAQS